MDNYRKPLLLKHLHFWSPRQSSVLVPAKVRGNPTKIMPPLRGETVRRTSESEPRCEASAGSPPAAAHFSIVESANGRCEEACDDLSANGAPGLQDVLQVRGQAGG